MKNGGPELGRLLRDCGIQATYEDVTHKRRRASQEALLALLHAYGVPIESPDAAEVALRQRRIARWSRGIEPVIVAWNGSPPFVRLTLPANSKIDRLALRVESDNSLLEESVDFKNLPPIADPMAESAGFVTRRLPLNFQLPLGYHRLKVHLGPRTLESLILAAPHRAYRRDELSPLNEDAHFHPPNTNPKRERGNAPNTNPKRERGNVPNTPPAPARDWGCFLPLYALRTACDWGLGDFSSLRDFAHWAGRRSAADVGVLPLLAAFLDAPFEISPYRPVSRMFWNEIYLDVEAIPEFAHSPAAQQIVASTEFQNRIRAQRQLELVDYREGMSLKRRVLQRLADDFFAARPPRYADFDRHLKAHPAVGDYAAFRAATERQQAGWPHWSPDMRAGRLTETDYDPRARNYHAYVQWQCIEQLTNLRRQSEQANCGLYLDLPIGVDPWGFDMWRFQSSYIAGASAGAPPDVFFSKGQEWGLPPLHPEQSRESGHDLLRRVLETNMRFARHLRVDHILGFHRMYCIPPGFAASAGAYIQYPADEIYAVAIIESHRNRCELIGENLGTVPPAVDRALEKHGIAGMWVAPYELEPGRRGLEMPSPNQAAAINTHDMPPFAGWWSGDDIRDRHDLGHIGDKHLPAEHMERATAKQKMLDWTEAANEGQTPTDANDPPLIPLLRKVAASPARLVIVNVEDFWLETRPQNVPGTSTERPNWRRKARYTLEEFSQLPAIDAAVDTIAQARHPDDNTDLP